MLRLVRLVWAFSLVVAPTYAIPTRRICAQYSETQNRDTDYSQQDDYDEPLIIPTAPLSTTSTLSPETVQCSDDFDFCFALWSTDTNSSKVIKQGCWKESVDKNATCLHKDCLSTGSTGTKNLHYCCCSGDLCNLNMTVVDHVETVETVISTMKKPTEESKAQILWLTPVLLMGLTFLSVLLMALIFFMGCKTGSTPGPEAAPLAPSGPGYSSNLQNVDNLKVCSMLGQGKYGTVWKGMINEQAVAVKIFPANHKQYFINERNIYSLPLMDSPSLLQYFGSDERRTLDDQIEYFLVLCLAPMGCLQDWLNENITSYSVFCNMAKSVARGLSHLHTELQRGDDLKPCICHRDLNTRNILVKADLSCCISDFGFALKVFGSKYEYKGEMALAETKSINEVGTLRYMAPEILEGAVNLRDCETALKQIDVYSLGLVLWELCTRCQDLYPQGQVVPPYKAPYEAEIGKSPTFEQMQVLVARHKARPLFPAGWGGGAAGKIIRDTCEDCWDHDAEARLTSLCAEERMQELLSLRPRSHALSRGPSPPLSANNLAPKSPTKRFRSMSANSFNSDTGAVITPPNQNMPRVRSCGNESSSSGMLNLAATQPGTEKNHLICHTQQIQPYQGRNPCLERNLAPVTQRPNQILVEKSKKHSFQEKGQENSFSCLEDDVSVEDLISNHSKKLGVDEESIMGQGFPKQNNTDKKLRGWHGVRALIQEKLFRKDPYNFGQHFDEKSNLVDNRLAAKLDSPSPTKDITVNLIVDSKNNCRNGAIQTKIDATFRRPNNLDLPPPITVRVNGLSPENHNKSNLGKNIADEYSCTFRQPLANGISSISNAGQSNAIMAIPHHPPRIVVSKSANAVKSLNQSNSPSALTNADEKQLLTRQRSLEVFREVFRGKGSTDKLRDPSQRVKTPGDVPASVRKVRASKTLSLYDDRMMDSSGLHVL